MEVERGQGSPVQDARRGSILPEQEVRPGPLPIQNSVASENTDSFCSSWSKQVVEYEREQKKLKENKA